MRVVVHVRICCGRKYKVSAQHLIIWNEMNEASVFNGPEV